MNKITIDNNKLDNMINNIMDNLCDKIVVDAKTICPVKTGNLSSSIEIKDKDYSTDDKSALIGSDVNYSLYVEMGTIRMSPRSYLRKSVEDLFKK